MNKNKTSFKIFLGDNLTRPFIVESPDDIKGLNESLVINVPIYYEEAFRDYFEQFLKKDKKQTYEDRKVEMYSSK